MIVRHAGRLIVPFLIGLLLLAMPAGAADKVQFSWAVLHDTDQGLRTLDFSSPPRLTTGSTIQVYLEQKPGAFIYLYLIDASGDLDFLFPGEPDFYASVKPTDRIFRVPADTDRFELTPPGGEEKLYLLASSVRLFRLEELTAAYMEQPGDPVRKADVIKELKLIRRDNSTLAQTTETSVPVAGTIRSRGVLFDSFEVTTVNADGFYSRILRLHHD